MQKEGSRSLINSQDGKIKIVLLFSIALIFLLTMLSVEAIFSIRLYTPGNFTFNSTGVPNFPAGALSTRNINFTFNFTSDINRGTNPSDMNGTNCSLFINTTTDKTFSDLYLSFVTGAVNVSNSTSATVNGNISNNSINSYINFTFARDGNYTWNVGCLNSSSGGGVPVYNMTSGNFSFLLDASPPTFNFSAPGDSSNDIVNTTTIGSRSIVFGVNDSVYGDSLIAFGLNMSMDASINVSINLGGTLVNFFMFNTTAAASNLTCSQANSGIIKTSSVCNTTYSFNFNGTYLINASAVDAGDSFKTRANFNATIVKLVVDQIPPVQNSLNLSNGTGSNIDGTSNLGASNAADVSTVDGTLAQGKKLTAVANFTDNLTRPAHADLQFFNITSSSWQTINTTTDLLSNISPSATSTVGSANLSFTPPVGYNEFEGRNISFRIIANDTLGNRLLTSNFSAIRNITVQINDTTKPTLIISSVGGIDVANFSNTTDTTPEIRWNITEHNALQHVSVQVDGSTSADAVCNLFVNYSTPALANLNRNGTLTVKGPSDQAGCSVLTNGTHNVTLSARDGWNNLDQYVYLFTVQTGEGGDIVLGNISSETRILQPAGINPTNNSNITPTYYLAFNVTLGAGGRLKNFTWTSSCNSSVNVAANDTMIAPFNYTGCKSAEANQTITVIANTFTGSSLSRLFQFMVDEVGPSLAVSNPTPGFNGNDGTSGNLTITLSGRDTQSLSSFGFFLDNGIDPGQFVSLNLSTAIGTQATNITNSFSIGLGAPGVGASISGPNDIKPGTHKIKFRVNDTLGNARNSSIITFTYVRTLNFSSLDLNSTLRGFWNGGNISLVNITNASNGMPLNNETANFTGQTLNLFMALNTTTRGVNLTIAFNFSAANWDLYNFTVRQNDSTGYTTMNDIVNNWTVTMKDFVSVNESINEFLPDNNSYYGIVKYPINASGYTLGGQFEVWYFPDIKDVSSRSKRQNLTECSAGFNPSFTLTVSAACWNNTDNKSINVYVPHFSAVAFVNNTDPPTVNVTTPSPAANQSVSIFIPNITVSADAISCVYSLNSTVANITMTKSGNVCLGQTERFKNLNDPALGYNYTFTVIDEEGNSNNYVWKFNVTDFTSPNSPNSTVVSSSPSTTSATVTVGAMNESVNVTLKYSTSISVLSSVAMETDFNQSQSVSVIGLSASTLYYFNVSVCDFNGNCATNGTFNFTTSAAAAAAAAASTTSSSGASGSAGGAASASNTAASTGKQWDNIEAGSSGVLTINNEKIAVTGVSIEVANTVSNAGVDVESLVTNPLTTPAAGKVYQYLQITKKNIAEADTSKITISFKVPKSWLSATGVAEADVVLFRYTNSVWSQLPTTMTGSDANNALYDATTPGFSTFAVGSKEAGPTVALGVEICTDITDNDGDGLVDSADPDCQAPPTPVAEVCSDGIDNDLDGAIDSADSDCQVAPVAPVEQKKGLSGMAITWILLAIIAVIAIIGFVAMRKKQ